MRRLAYIYISQGSTFSFPIRSFLGPRADQGRIRMANAFAVRPSSRPSSHELPTVGRPFFVFSRNGARLALGSDFPVEGIDPLLGFYAAVTRLDLEGHSPHGDRGWSADLLLVLVFPDSLAGVVR